METERMPQSHLRPRSGKRLRGGRAAVKDKSLDKASEVASRSSPGIHQTIKPASQLASAGKKRLHITRRDTFQMTHLHAACAVATGDMPAQSGAGRGGGWH